MHAPITCRYAPLAELGVHEPQTVERWLSPAEYSLWSGLRNPGRRDTFLAGRIVAKRLLGERLHAAPTAIVIDSRSPREGHGERPAVVVANEHLAWSLSIAHTHRGVLVALCTEPGLTLGVDLVSPENRLATLAWTFSAAEQQSLAAGMRLERIWAMKEAVYKACQQGEGFAPARIEVIPEVRYPHAGADRAVHRLQTWRIDRQIAALAVAVAA